MISKIYLLIGLLLLSCLTTCNLVVRSILEDTKQPDDYASYEDISTENFDNSNSNQIASSLQCESVPFQHIYLESNSRQSLHLNQWRRARVGESVALRDICLKLNGLPVTRKCLFNKKTRLAEWEPLSKHLQNVKCLQRTRRKIISDKLNALHGKIIKERMPAYNITQSLCNTLDEQKDMLLPADLYFTSEILKQVAPLEKDAKMLPNLVSICCKWMRGDKKVLRLSAELNSTNEFLHSFETFTNELSTMLVKPDSCSKPKIPMQNTAKVPLTDKERDIIDLSHIGVFAQLAPNVNVFYLNPLCSNISGIAIYENTTSATQVKRQLYFDARKNYQYGFLYMNESYETLMQEQGLQVASFVPLQLWQHIKQQFLSSIEDKHAKIVFKVFSHDGLFVDTKPILTHMPFSKVISISIPNYHGTFPELLPLVLRHAKTVNISGFASCGYWNYSTWIDSGIKTLYSSKEGIICGTEHLTAFSGLITSNAKQGDISGDVLISPIHERALDIISIVGCSLSILGLLGIWITAMLFRKWRTQSSTKVLLNLCIALTLQMVLFVFINTDDMSEQLIEQKAYTTCVILGALLQYSILVLFTWMLIVAFLQFQRYVTVIGISRPRHYIIKSALIAWGLPIIPTVLTATLARNSYIPSEYQLENDTGICYPSGHALILGVVMPITAIVICNLFIFAHVLFSIANTLSQSMQKTEKQTVLRQVRLSVLLFFLLGLSWIFGIFAFMHAGILFSYLFCLTASMQGFVLFIYFVILDPLARVEWLSQFVLEQEVKVKERSSEVKSMNTASTSFEIRNQH